MSLNANAIATLAQLRSYMGKDAADVSANAEMEAAINSVSEAIEHYTRRVFVQRTITDELYNGDGSCHLVLRSTPVISLKTPALNELQWRSEPGTPWLDIETSLNYILIDQAHPYRITLWRESFPRGMQNVKVTYKAGYAAVPADVLLVCLEAAAIRLKESGRGDGRLGRDTISNGTGGVSTTDSFSDLIDRHKKAISGYRWVTP